MALLTSIRDGLKTRLETISGLTASEFVPDYIVPSNSTCSSFEYT